jgi:hypothetical protein
MQSHTDGAPRQPTVWNMAGVFCDWGICAGLCTSVRSTQRGWPAIRQARRTTVRRQEETSSLTRRVIEAVWDAYLQGASDHVGAETDRPIASPALPREEVFDAPYTVEHSS